MLQSLETVLNFGDLLSHQRLVTLILHPLEVLMAHGLLSLRHPIEEVRLGLNVGFIGAVLVYFEQRDVPAFIL